MKLHITTGYRPHIAEAETDTAVTAMHESAWEVICAAVNSHDTLVAALRTAAQCIRDLRQEAPAHTWIDSTCDTADMALEGIDAALKEVKI